MRLMEIFDRRTWSNSTPSQGGGKQIKYLANGGEEEQRRTRRIVFGLKYLWDPTKREALILPPHFDFGAVFGQNEALETHLFRNQKSELKERFFFAGLSL